MSAAANCAPTDDWLLSVHARHAVAPSEIVKQLLRTHPVMLCEVMTLRARNFLVDMVASGAFDKSVIEDAAAQVAADRDPAEQAVALSEAGELHEGRYEKEQSGLSRWIESRGCDPVAVLEALVESGAITMRGADADLHHHREAITDSFLKLLAEAPLTGRAEILLPTVGG